MVSAKTGRAHGTNTNRINKSPDIFLIINLLASPSIKDYFYENIRCLKTVHEKNEGIMCGRFIFTDPAKIKGLIPDADIDQLRIEFAPNYNIAPSQNIPAILNDGSNKVRLIRWGLVPSWAKDLSVGYKMINARAETLTEKPAFKRLIKSRRCLIFTEGFYEWKKLGKTKQPYFIRMKDQRAFAFAGLWDIWEKDGDALISGTIITTDANELIAEIHERMPVIIPPDSYGAWLEHESKNVLNLLKSFSAAEMEAYPVSRLVSSTASNSPDNIFPA
jgi:putative SOS response-associated peptidase YedK